MDVQLKKEQTEIYPIFLLRQNTEIHRLNKTQTQS